MEIQNRPFDSSLTNEDERNQHNNIDRIIFIGSPKPSFFLDPENIFYDEKNDSMYHLQRYPCSQLLVMVETYCCFILFQNVCGFENSLYLMLVSES